tara:strand:+ start:126 stop:248 length:123 start_codon:yes stop_codon:yes gene_type:complete
LSEQALAILVKSYNHYVEQGDVPIIRALADVIAEIRALEK